MGFDQNGFAYGLEFFSTANQEELLYNIGIEFEKANGNKVNTSPLTPSLYEVPSEVNELITYYEKILATNSQNKKVIKWLNNVQNYFKNYNDYDDITAEANKLLASYQDENIEDIFNHRFWGNIDLTRLLVYIFFILVTAIIVMVFFNEFFEKN